MAEKILKAFKFVEENKRTNGRTRLISLGLDSPNVAQKIISIYKKVLL